jgi:uncharacterized membrane protein
MKILFTFALFSMFFTTVVLPHGGKDHKKEKTVKQDTLTIVGRDTIAVNGKAINKSVLKQKPVDKKEPEFVLSLNEEMSSHLHNKIVHFPIAIGVLAFFFSLLHLKRKNYDTTVFILVVLGLIFSLVAFFTGINQVEPFVGTGKYWVVDLHRYFGISILITYFIWLFFLLVEKTKRYAWIIGLVVFILILVTGFLGGVIAH